MTVEGTRRRPAAVPDESGRPDGAAPRRKGFFTDTSVCIGCKACEVACKEWNTLAEDGRAFTGMSYDNTGGLSATTWRHVAFVEPRKPMGRVESGVGTAMPTTPAAHAGHVRPAADHSGLDVLAMAAAGPAETVRVGEPPAGRGDFRWLMSSDVCKHCTHAACLDVCPTGALFRTEFETVVVQQDICNGCGYCVSACPFGVIARDEDDGRVFKCTMCYDRIGAGMTPACAQACPTESIVFGDLDDLREQARRRVGQLHEQGVHDARLYGADEDGVGGQGAFFLLLDQPEVYGLPPDPVVTTRDLASMWRHAGAAALALAVGTAAVFAGGLRRGVRR